MASSEIQSGAAAYLITGSGMDVSTKSLNAIGREIIEGYREKNVKIVCRKKAIDAEKLRLTESLKTKHPDDSNKAKLGYLENYTLSMSEFAEKMKKHL